MQEITGFGTKKGAKTSYFLHETSVLSRNVLLAKEIAGFGALEGTKTSYSLRETIILIRMVALCKK